MDTNRDRLHAGGIDLLILEDYGPLRELLTNTATTRYGLNVIAYESGRSAIADISSVPVDKLPLGFLVDMNISIGEGDDRKREQASSKELRKLLGEKDGPPRYFKFMTAHYSGHDEDTLESFDMDVCDLIIKGQNGDITPFFGYFRSLQDAKQA